MIYNWEDEQEQIPASGVPEPLEEVVYTLLGYFLMVVMIGAGVLVWIYL